ncbi:lipopolysaccharide biosynthesis protein [Pedobacter gandavensis]|uniref:lipopolysaccharide biosynthesis protein n=1 Tax=Pedobacter gandavensis TaxID=2679963 RepID=UPI00292E2211|nr:lipopolysaccharide biosynthesis protein [Pedobacter gandavensis]
MNTDTNIKNTSTSSSKGGEDEELTLRELILKVKEWWKYLLSKWRIIVFAGIIGGILGFANAYFKKTVYKAGLSFALEDEKSGGGLGGALGLASQFGFDVGSGGGAFSGGNLLELMKSRSMVEKTLLTAINVNDKVQTLAELYISFNGFRDEWSSKPWLKDVQFLPHSDRTKFSLKQDSLLGVFSSAILKNNLTVSKKDKDLSIILVNVKSENEKFSKFFTEILVKEVSDFYVITKTKKSAQNVLILQHQTDSVRRALNGAISGVAISMDANPNANPSRQILRVPSQRKQVDVQANQSILTELVKNLEISKVSLRKETPLIQIIDTPILPLEQDKLGKLKGMILGGIGAGFLVALVLLIRKNFKEILQ